MGNKLKVSIHDDRSRDALSLLVIPLEKTQNPGAAYGLKLSRIRCVQGGTFGLKDFQQNRFKFQIDGAKATLHGDLKLFYQTPELGKSSWI